MKSALAGIAAAFACICAAFAAIPSERPVSAPVYASPHDHPSVASAASDGRNFLLAYNAWDRGAIYAARIAPDGTLLDPTGIFVAHVAEPSYSPNDLRPWVFWTGDVYLLLWYDGHGLLRARLDSDGKIVDPPQTVIETATVSSVATNGARLVVAYDKGRLAVLDLSGRALERDIVVPGGGAMTLASNGSGFLATWANVIPIASTFSAVALDASGHPAGAPQTFDVPVDPPFALASNGSDYLAVVPIRSTGARRALHISAAGDVLESHDLAITSLTKADALVWTGTEYLFTGGGAGVRLTASGVPIDSAPLQVGTTHSTTVAGGKLLLAWSDFELHAEVIALPALTHTAPVLVSVAAAEQSLPAIAFSGPNYLVVWNELTFAKVARLDADGRLLDAAPIVLSDGTAFPKAVFDGKNFVVAWWGNPLHAQTIDPDSGRFVASINFASGRIPDLASDGNVTMVVYELGGTLQAQRLTHDLQPMEAPLTITPKGMIADNPRVTWSGTQWVVAFNERLASGETVRVARISPSMTIVDTQPILVAEHNAASPSLASSGDDVLIAWSGLDYDVFARHMLPNGTLGPEIPLGSANFYLGNVIWTGTTYAVSFSSRNFDAVAVTVGKFGATSAGPRLTISATADRERAPILVTANGRITAAYERQASEPVYGGAWRVFVRDAQPMHGRIAKP